MNRLPAIVICCSLIVSSCNNTTEPDQNEFVADERYAKELTDVREIIYSMYLPTDLAEILEQSGANFDPALPAPVTDIQLYDDPEQISIMLGVYGVDLSYMKILDQPLMAAEYFRVLENMAAKAGVPEDIFKSSSRLLERNLGNKDSLAFTIQQIYKEMDEYFRENGKENMMALSLLGGWIEAMYIGTAIYDSELRSVAMAEKILQQKFSLNSVISVLSEHQQSLHITRCLLMLKKLKKEFEKVQIMYAKEGFSVDTTEKKIFSRHALINYDEATLKQINLLIGQIRTELIKTEV